MIHANELGARVIPRWHAYHIYYHDDRDRVLLELVHPIVARLVACAQIESFFFVRYDLGGPHIRLRLCTYDGSLVAVHEAVTRAVARFFTRWPSLATLPEQVVRERSEGLRAIDPHELDTKLYGDNTCVSVEPSFEVMRYGGKERLQHSLDYFAISSAYAIEVVWKLRDTPRLGAAMRSYIWQAWGFAKDGAEFMALLGYARVYWEGLWREAAENAEVFFEQRRERMCQLLADELEVVATCATDEDSPMLGRLAGGAQLVGSHIRVTERGLRLSIGMSHMHMTANRIGLTNIEEAHVGRVLRRAVNEVAMASPQWWENLWQRPRCAPSADLATLRSDSCARLCHTGVGQGG